MNDFFDMASNAVALETRPTALTAMSRHLQAAVEAQGVTATLEQDGDCLVIHLSGPICPDPLLSMVSIEQALKPAQLPGIKAVRLLGYSPDLVEAGWLALIDLNQYFSQAAQQPPEAFGLDAAVASRLACQSELGASAVEQDHSSPHSPIATSENAPNAHPEQLAELTAPKTNSHLPSELTTNAAEKPLAARTGFDTYREFIANDSNWFAQSVKDNPHLHEIAKQRQHYAIGTLSHYISETLRPDESLVDLLPVRQRKYGCGMIFTDQRVIALSQPYRKVSQGLRVWMVPWSWVHKVEISSNALRFHYGKTKERFSFDIATPYHLRSAIPRDVPVRIVHSIPYLKRPALSTTSGMAMIAGIMFALGSGFSAINHMAHRRFNSQEDLAALSTRVLGAETSPIQSAPKPSQQSNPKLEITTDQGECISTFNQAAQPHAYATLNRVTQTLQINVRNQSLNNLSTSEFDRMASAVAQEVLASCQATTVQQVQVTNGTQRYIQERAPSPFTANSTDLNSDPAVRDAKTTDAPDLTSGRL